MRTPVKRELPAKRRRPPWLFKVGTSLVGVGAFFGSVWYFWENVGRYAYPVEYVRIEGTLLHLNEGEFTAAIAPLAKAGLFDIDLEAIAGIAKGFAWVDSARVIRHWPDTLILRIREHHPVARWNEDSLLSDRGARFSPPDAQAFSDLPRLYGNDSQQTLVLEVWKKMNELLQPQGWAVSMLSSNSRQSWIARLSDGKELMIGRQDPVANVERLLSMLPELGSRQVAAIQRIDLRYRNGFAVIWRLPSENDSEAPGRESPKPVALKQEPYVAGQTPQFAANQW